MPSRRDTFYQTITEAVADFSEHGYDSAERLEYWLRRIREAAVSALIPEAELERQLRDTLATVYARLVDGGQIFRYTAEVSKFTLQQVKPKLHSELDRRILASASLIKLNRQASLERTTQRFIAWATSIPTTGVEGQRRETAAQLRKAMASLPFEERRVIIDQGHKLVAAISDIVATDGGAIAARWHSHWRQTNYKYRPDHKERDDKVYAIRGSWALEQGLMKPGPAGYTDEITQPAQEVFCRCFYTYLFTPQELPDDMLTEKGRAFIKRGQEERRRRFG